MDAMEAIRTRRSIRKYTGKPVSENLVKEILRAGMMAPSAGNQQPWHFVVADDRSVLNEIPKTHPYAGAVKESPVAIVVCGDTRLEKHEGYWVQDCSAAVQNMLLAAHSLGLGTVWLGVFPRGDRVEGLRKLFGLPKEVIPLAVIAVGYAAEKRESTDRFDAARIHRNKW